MSVTSSRETAAVVPGGSDPVHGAPDALLFVSFGGPEAPGEVMPFLQRVTAGRNIPDERLRLVGQHYFDRGGVSPINELCRDMISRLQGALASGGIDLPVYWGNRNSAPFLTDTLAEMANDGVSHALAFVTSAFGSYSGCRQYRENIAAARDAVGSLAPHVTKLRLYFNHPGFIDPLVDGLRAALESVDSTTTRVVFTAHSIPLSMASSCDYVAQLESAMAIIAEQIDDMPGHELAWQSRSGPPSMPWLEPDVCDVIAGIDDGVTDVVVVPLGFVSDHMEVIQDLDTDARSAADERGIGFQRVATSGTDERFISMIVELVSEHRDGVVAVTLGDRGREPTQCSATCCPRPVRPTRPSGPPRSR